MTPTEIPSPTPQSTETPTPQAIPTPRIEESVSLRPVTFTIKTNADGLLGYQGADAIVVERQGAIAQIRKVFSDGLLMDDQIAGMVLAFGGSPDKGEGPKLSFEVNNLLKSEYGYTFGNAETRDYLDFGLPRGHVRVEVFLFAKR